MAKYTLQAHERLKSKKLIDQLFESGQSCFAYPIKLIHQDMVNQNSPLKMGVSVPKKLINKASDRNLIKRRIRESYRQLCIQLKESCIEKGKQKMFMFIYVGKTIEPYSKIEQSVIDLLDQVIDDSNSAIATI